MWDKDSASSCAILQRAFYSRCSCIFRLLSSEIRRSSNKKSLCLHWDSRTVVVRLCSCIAVTKPCPGWNIISFLESAARSGNRQKPERLLVYWADVADIGRPADTVKSLDIGNMIGRLCSSYFTQIRVSLPFVLAEVCLPQLWWAGMWPLSARFVLIFVWQPVLSHGKWKRGQLAAIPNGYVRAQPRLLQLPTSFSNTNLSCMMQETALIVSLSAFHRFLNLQWPCNCKLFRRNLIPAIGVN